MTRPAVPAPFEGVNPERWLVRLLVTRDPGTESPPSSWDWPALLDGGNPTVLSAEMVGYETESEEP